MNVLIIEDENRAARRLHQILLEINPQIEVLEVCESIREGITTMNQLGTRLDLIISDIQLADGLSFEIFSAVASTCPIIFTTAYDQYAIKAFETNGVDYLLKPIVKERLEKALGKVEQLQQKPDLSALIQLSQTLRPEKTYRERFVVKIGDKLRSIPVSEINVVYSMEKGTYLHTQENRNYSVDYTMDQVASMLDPRKYYRINRKYIVHIDAAAEMIAHSNSRLKLLIPGFESESIIVARERVSDFKTWLAQ